MANAELWDRRLIRPRIYGGQERTIEQLGGYAVQIYLGNRLICGGTLVSSRYIVTSAHCFASVSDYTQYHVVAGETETAMYFPTEDSKNSVLKLKIHPKYERTQFIADIAVVSLSIPYKKPNVNYLPLCSQKPAAGNVATVSGWGVSEYYHDTLRAMKVPLIDETECSRKMERTMPDNVICAAGYNGRTLCHGDSGGPLVINGELCGISTWTSKCGNHDMPDVFMSVYYYRDFINKTIADMRK
ncbi:trypsin-3 [Drosophila hydei]|uniref:Trypsin-3 n=1 Tax=Drosophila hydei TaxID=7224 RepID=A0A6J1L439_DROHY|nr:trypsin-3 [Drosophila hydei]